MQIGVPAETLAGETRVAVTPETVKKLKSQGHTVRIQSGAGVAASVTDEAYVAAGADITDAAGALSCDLVLKVRTPTEEEAASMTPGATLVGMLNPFDAEGLQRLAAAKLNAYALEAAPRTTRAQSMDVLSSQANIAGYKAVMMAADKYQRFFPMLMTAAGTVKAARVVILGVGVAALANGQRQLVLRNFYRSYFIFLIQCHCQDFSRTQGGGNEFFSVLVPFNDINFFSA